MIKITSWNINGIRAVNKKGKWDEFIQITNPDIICLQEIKANEEQIDFLNDNYYKLINSAGRAGYSGTAILSKEKPLNTYINFSGFKIKNIEKMADTYGDANNEGRVSTAEFKNFYVVSVYTPNAKDDLSRLNFKYTVWDPIFLEYVKDLQKIKPVIITGDLNVAHTEIDLANPKTNKGKKGFTNEEREGFENLLKLGFIDTFRSLHKEPNNYTWWSHFARARERNVGWRIDYILISNSLADKLISATIDRDIFGSDHCPVSIELDF